jgi:hypothetical protein
MPDTLPGMSDPLTPDVPGRGAWRLQGGLLPLRKGSTSRSGYYRLAGPGETPVGSAYVRKTAPDRSDSARAVNLGVQALQALCGLAPVERDGWYGKGTDAAVRAAQDAHGVTVDGVVGRGTMKALLRAIVEDLVLEVAPAVGLRAEFRECLGGLAAWESALDPAAVGVSGYDHGLVQINLAAHTDVTPEDAHNPWFALRFAATDLRATYDRWAGKTVADPLDVAVANHNSPRLARQYAETGVWPVVIGRVIQIEDYVVKVRAAW